MNKVILMGRLTADPEMRQTPQGTAVARFTIAVNRRFQREGGQQADFISCTAWRQTAENICRFFNKGRMIAIEGQIQTRSWDGQDGKKQYATDVVVDNFYFTGSRQETGGSQGGYQSGGSYQSNFSDGGYQPPREAAPQAPVQDTGFTDLSFTDDAGSEDDLPF